jgi:ABC-2 type transport system ATP-binding protein
LPSEACTRTRPAAAAGRHGPAGGAVRLDGVAKRYGIRLPWVVRAVSMEIPPGALVRFEGKNGSGKSTLLRVIAGVCEPSRGAVIGRPATGYVPERFPPALPFPAREYLSHVGRMHGLVGKELESRIEACLDRLGGRELAEVPMRTMSKGMCQKVAVAQALLPRSGLLVLDEAWTGLDAEAKASLDDAIAERISGGGRVVFVDHEPGRLAHLHAERWRLQEARATRVAEPQAADREVNAASTPTRPATAAPTRAPTSGRVPLAVEIEVSGRPGVLADLTAAVGAQPGVLSVRRHGARVFIRAEADSSDAVLRRLLAAEEEAHVLRVGAEPDPGGPPMAGEGGR